jgi:peptidyl-prolyl cis-trans isomerase SurA
MQNEAFRVVDFLTFVNGQNHRSSKTPAETLQDLFTGYVDAVQIDLLEKRVMRDSPDYKWLLREYYEGILLFEIMEKEVWNRAMEDSVGQRNYFNSHAGKYTAGDRIAGKIFTSSSSEKLQELKVLLDSNAAIEDFVTKSGIKVQEGPFEKGDRSFLADIDWTPGTHAGSSGGTHYLVLIEKILPPGAKTFDEARASVISDYQSYLEEAWIKELKAKFGVKIKKKRKKQVFRELTRNKT